MNFRTFSAGILLIGCIGLLQVHSIAFWSASVDPVTGLFWSLVLEGAALWLWSARRLHLRLLGALVTVLLLAGPLYQVSAPLFAEQAGVAAAAQRRTELQAEIASAETALSAFLTNSQQRVGWAGRIDAAQGRLDAARAELAGLTRAGAEVRMDWQRQAVIGLQALAIAVLQLVGVLCIGELRRAAPAPAAAPGAEEGAIPAESQEPPAANVPRGMRRLHRPASATPEPLRAAVA
ncbi:MAG: hypothetical protein AB1450_13365 [Pseudomonadota bacterium]